MHSVSHTRRRDAAQSRLQETSLNNDNEQAEVSHRASAIRSLGRRQSGRGYTGCTVSPGNVEPAGPSSRQPPALEYYTPSDEECVSGEDTDADEMAEDCNRGEYDSLAEKSSAALSDIDITDSEEEPDEQDQEDDNVMGDSLQQRDNSRSKSQPATAAHHDQASPSDSKRRSQKQHQHLGQGSHSGSSSRHQQNRKRPRLAQEQEDQQEGEQEIDCSSEQYAADVRRLRESKLKHNKNEQMRRKDMKEAVHRLRNQLRRKTKKPSTISVLKAAKQEIDELTAIKVEEEKELERLRQRELFLKYQLENLVSDYNQRLPSSGNAGLVVSSIPPGVVGPTPSFPHSSPTAAVAAAATNPPRPPPPPLPLPPSLLARPGLHHAQFPHLFPAVLPSPPAVSHSTSATVAAASSPTAIGRVGLIADHPHRPGPAAHASSAALSPITRLPIPHLPQPPALIPAAIAANFSNNPSTPPSAGVAVGGVAIGGGGGGRGPSTPPTAAATPGATISIFPAPPPGSAVIPGLAPLHLLPPRTATTNAAAGQPSLYAGFPSPILMSYPGIAGTRHPPPTATLPMVGPGLTASHPAIGRLAMASTFPFYQLPTALRPSTAAIGVPGFGHYSAASQPSTRHLQLLACSESPTVHTVSSGHSRRSSGEDRNVQTTEDSESHHRSSSSAGSKNGVVSAETYGAHTQSPGNAIGSATSVREVSAESRYVAGSSNDDGVCTVTVVDSRENEEYGRRTSKRSRNDDSNNDDDDDSYIRSRTTMEKRQRVFNRYNRNGVLVSVEKNVSKKHLLSAAPPLLKVINSEADQNCDTSDKKWSEGRHQQFVCERADQNRYQHQCTLPSPPALRNAEVISTVIKHMHPQRDIVSANLVTGVSYGDHEKEFELCNGVELKDSGYRGGAGGGGGDREQRYRMSNSLSSSDAEGPDSPLSQQKFSGPDHVQTTCSCTRKLGRDGVYVQVAGHCKHSSSNADVNHRNSQYRSLRKKKANSNHLHRPNHGCYHSVVLQTTT